MPAAHLRVRKFLVLSTLATIATASLPVFAGTLSMRIIDRNGDPVTEVVVDLRDPSTGAIESPVPDIPALDGTLVATVPDGVYEVRLKPDTGTSLAGKVIPALSTVGTVNLGDVELEDGFAIAATIVDSSGFAVAGADIDLRDAATGVKLFTPSDTSNALGFVEIVAPEGVYDWLVSPPALSGLAPRRKTDVVLSADVDFGLFTLRDAVTLSGRVVKAGPIGVANVDVDVADAFTGESFPLSNDDTDALGFFSIVVPSGDLNVSFLPPQSERLAGLRRVRVAAPADTSLGDVTLAPGSLLSGRVTRAGMVNVAGADIDILSTAGVLTPTFGDDSQANGLYSAVGPKTTVDVLVSPPDSLALQHVLVTGQDLSFDRVLDVTLPSTVATVDLDAADVGLFPGDRVDFSVALRNRSGVARTVRYSAAGSLPGTAVSRPFVNPTDVPLGAAADPLVVGPFSKRIPPTLRPRFRNIPVRITVTVVDPGTLAVLDFDIAHFIVY